MSLLEVSGLSASYGAAPALFDVSLTIAEGEAVALIGRNGMGKTSTISAICRLLPSRGRLRLAGQDLRLLPPHRAARLGLGLVPEGRRIFAPLTVTENLVAAARPGRWSLPEVHRVFPRLKDRARQIAGSLSGGEQQMLAIARALMTNPRLLLLDEATEGLAPLVRQEIWAALGALRETGDLSLLIVDKSLSELSGIADRAVILERGRSVADLPFSAITDSVKARYLGL